MGLISRLFLLSPAFTGTAVLAISAPAPAPEVFAGSNPSCPAFPAPEPGTYCGPYTRYYTEYCQNQAALTDFTGYVNRPKDYLVDAGDYAFYHMLHTEYLVEFSKYPVKPYQKPLSLPYCGLPHYDGIHKRGNWWKEKVDKPWKGFVSNVAKGTPTLPIPWLEYPPKRPELLPRPVCIPTHLQIPVHFTVFTTNHSTASLVDVYALDRQIRKTNEAFDKLNITFYIGSINYHIGQQWERFTHHKYEQDPEYFAYSERIKAENRYGNNDEVNVWVVESIGEPNCTTGAHTTGYCTFARNLLDPGHQVDGCPIVIDSLPGVVWRGTEGRGTTLTHEIGHWLDLEHIFPDSDDCTGESDSITDTYQFPGGGMKYKSQQPRCCESNGKWDFCGDAKQYNVTNYMSYSPQRGQWLTSNDEGAAPWTTEQRAHMFSSFFTLRRPAPKGTVNVKCSTYPVWADQHPAQTRALFRRAGAEYGPITTRDWKGPHLFRQGNYLLEQLKDICSKKPTDGLKGIDIISGEVVPCAEDGICQPPSKSGARCPDGTHPPCKLAAWCPDGSRPSPNCEPLYLCDDGSVPPCTGKGGDVRPSGGENNKTSCPVVVNNDPHPKPPTPPSAPATCPAGCNPLSGHNKCDVTTAPTCIYPDPRVPKPRAACACRPGYKAYRNGEEPKGEMKQWRLPIVGQEHRVWVAEGVRCDVLCDVSSGVGSCREVVEVDAGCVGY